MVVSKEMYPFQPQYHVVDSHRMHYVDEGEGDPILMIHGNPTWSFYYRNLIKEFSTSHRVIAPDHIGCGLSEKPDDSQYDFTLERRVQDLESLVTSLGLKDITLVVHDWGGMIGFTFATRFPELIKSLVVFNTAAFHNPKGLQLPMSIRMCRTGLLGEILVRGFNAFSKGATLTCCTKKSLSAEEKRGYLAPYNNWKNRLAVHRFVKDIPLTKDDQAWSVVNDVEKRLSTLSDKPLLILWGEKDFVFDDKFLTRWREYFPHAEVHTYPDSGHFVVEDSHDDIVERMHSFVRH
ncbi:MAG: alpha/beta fold hydrolase [Pseudobacteriovorax sp.]|nr:alpha/beta fold hydrolase [Pseudobacteriovorax sp.]